MSLCGELALEEAVELLLDKLHICIYSLTSYVTDSTAEWVASSVTVQQQKLQSCLLYGMQAVD